MIDRRSIRIAAVVGLCFLLTSTGYLAWTYHIMALTQAPLSEVVTLIAGYLLQAAGLFLFALLLWRREDMIRFSMYAALAMHMLCLVPAVLGTSLLQALVFGLIQNLLIGWIGGYYLYRLARDTDTAGSPMALGIGYAGSIVLTWLLSLIGKEAPWHWYGTLAICLLLTVVTCASLHCAQPFEEAAQEPAAPPFNLQLPKKMSFGKFLLLAGALVFLFSIVNSCGFGFPSGDLENGIDLAFFRLFYAAGLLIAGVVNEKNRRYGAVCAVTALVIPFLMLAIRGEPVSLMIFWALSYFTFGFYTVYRIALFSDIAREKKLLWLSGAGLMIGRAGDAAGEALCLALSEKHLVLIGISAVLFMVSLLLFFHVYRFLYLPEARRQRGEREIFNHFSARHDLSPREREVLRFLLEEKTNKEIAEELSISEGTVKFHIHNLLQKTSCRNRQMLLSAYAAEECK